MELFKLLGTIAVNVSEAESNIDKITSKASQLGDTLGRTLQSAGDKISGVGAKMTAAVSLPLAALGTVSVSTAATFEDGMLKVQSLSGATQEEYEKLSEAAKQYGSTTAWTAKDVADAMGYMALAGFDTNEILSSTSGMLSLASASGEDLATVTDILTDSMTAFGDSADDAQRYADVLATTQAKSNTTVGLLGESFKYVAPLAGSYGYKLEDVATALGQMANAGVKGSMSGTALSSVITRLGTNTSGAREAIEELGVEFYNSDGTARNLSDVMRDLCDATVGMSVEQKASIASTVAGQEAQKGLLAILNQGSAAYSDLENKIKSCDGAASDMAANMESGLGGSIRSLKSALEGVAITLGEKLAPYVTKAAEKIKEFTEWFQKLDDKTQDNIVKFGLLVVAAGPVLSIFGKGISVVGTLVSAGGKLVGGIGSIISAGKTLFSGGTKLIGGIGSLIGKIGGGLLPALASIPAPVWVVIGVITALVAIGVALYKNWDEIKEWGQKTWASIKEIVGGAVEKIKGFFSSVINFVKDNWQGLALLLVNPFVGGFKLLYDNCDAFRIFIDNFLTSLKEGFQNFVTSVAEKAVELKDKVVGKIHELKDGAVEKFNEMKDGVVAKFTELKDNATAKIEELRAQAAEKIQNLKESAVEHFTDLKEKTVAKVSELKEKVVADFYNLKEQAAEKIADLKEKWGSKFEEAKEKIVSEVTELKERATGKINEFKEAAVTKIAEFKNSATQKFQEFKEQTVAKLGEVAAKGVEGFNAIREKGSAAIENLKNATASKFSEMANTVLQKFSVIGDKITSTFTKCRDTIHGIVEKIKGFFDFEWKLPEIKLPHFSIDGQFSLNPPSIPHIGVEWYANGGVMNSPTAFGINPANGKVMAGGEAGAEAIAPIETLKQYIREAVGENNSAEKMYDAITSLYELLDRYLPILSNKQVIMSTGELVGCLANPMNEALGRIAYRKEREG